MLAPSLGKQQNRYSWQRHGRFLPRFDDDAATIRFWNNRGSWVRNYAPFQTFYLLPGGQSIFRALEHSAAILQEPKTQITRASGMRKINKDISLGI